MKTFIIGSVMIALLTTIAFLSFRVRTLKLENLALQGEVMHWQGKVPVIAEHRKPFTKAKP